MGNEALYAGTGPAQKLTDGVISRMSQSDLFDSDPVHARSQLGQVMSGSVKLLMENYMFEHLSDTFLVVFPMVDIFPSISQSSLQWTLQDRTLILFWFTGIQFSSDHINDPLLFCSVCL